MRTDLAVTGASGFVGRAVVEAALRTGRSVRTLGGPHALANVDWRVDLNDPEALTAALAGASAVIHAAGLAHVFGPSARDWGAFERVNVVGTENVIRAAIAAGVKRFVLVSSVAVYGKQPDAKVGGPVTEVTPCAPVSPYGLSKLLAEECAARLSAGVLPLTILRVPTVYGEGDRGNMARLIRAIRRRRFALLGAGRNKKTLIHRDDAATACLCALNLPVRPVSTWNVTARSYTIEVIVKTISRQLGVEVWKIPCPVSSITNLVRLVARAMPGPFGELTNTLEKFFADDVYDGSRFSEEAGFFPVTELEDGLSRQIAAEAERSCL